MNNKIMIGIVAVALIGGYFTFTNNSSIGGVITNAPTYKDSNVSNNIDIGPDEDNRLVSTTSRRSYLLITSEGNGNVPVYCEASADVPATTQEGIKLSTSTSMMYEFTADRGNLYVGSVRCTATASTTVLVTEFAD